MRLAVPITADGIFCPHLGRCDGVWLAELDRQSGDVDRPRPVLRPQPHCDQLPDWIDQLAVDCILAAGIGAAAQARLRELGIDVITGLAGRTPEEIVEQYLRNPAGQANACTPRAHQFRHCQQ
jgi:predicted Fe-Mo cluster-binding NifX family protein